MYIMLYMSMHIYTHKNININVFSSMELYLCHPEFPKYIIYFSMPFEYLYQMLFFSFSHNEEKAGLWVVFIFRCLEQRFSHLEDRSVLNLKVIFFQEINRGHCKVNSHHLLCFCFLHLEPYAENILLHTLKESLSLSEELQMKGEVNWVLADTSKSRFYFNLGLQRVWRKKIRVSISFC